MNKIRKKYGIENLHQKGITGKDVCVAILDTGIYPHKDFDGRIIHFYDCVKGNKRAYDDSSHGTHVCGIIGGSGRQSNGLYKGIAPHCTLLPIKVLDKNGHGSYKAMINGIKWILQNQKKYNIKVVNISVGTESVSCADSGSELIKEVELMWEQGITVIASAGNNGPKYSTITIPGISSKIITVGASLAYSGKGPTHCNIPKPDIIASGSHIISCHNYGNGYTTKSGTSMSTPIVSGAAALAFSYNPKLTNEAFKEKLCLCARDLGLDRYTQGCGELDVNKLLLLINPLF